MGPLTEQKHRTKWSADNGIHFGSITKTFITQKRVIFLKKGRNAGQWGNLKNWGSPGGP